MACFYHLGKISESGSLAVDKATVLYDCLSSQGRILGLLQHSDQGPRVKTEAVGETEGEEGGRMETKYHSILL